LLQKTNLVPCLANPSLHIFQEDGLILALAIYVDDLMLIGNHNAKLEWVRDELCSQFDMSLLGLFTLYFDAIFFYITLGMFLYHCRYILKCLFNLGLDDYIPNLVPMEPGLLFKIDMLVPFVDQTYYCCVVEKLHVTHT
jgi:hypothetical protein